MAEAVQTLIILGASGDLTARLLLPALGQLLTHEPNRRVTLLGAGSQNWTAAHWRHIVRTSFATEKASGPAVDELLASTRYVTTDVTKPDDLKALLEEAEGTPALYFALPPAVTKEVCAALTKVELPDGLRLALEKPFGTDVRSAAALNRRLAAIVPEDQVHRIDHFLGNSTVQNLFGLRFANRIFEPLWNAQHVARVDIVFDEQLGLESRAGYYDHAGALVDMIQSHLLQVLAVTAMEPPATMSAADLRDSKGLVLRATKVWGDDAIASSHRGRYTKGRIDGRVLPSYVDEEGVDPELNTETLAQVTFTVDNWRWAGVPFTLRSGKAIGKVRHEIVITFRDAQRLPTGLRGAAHPTRLRIKLGPDEMVLELNTNGPGNPRYLSRSDMHVDFGPGSMLAYGEVLAGLLDGDPSLSVRGDTAVECWRIVAPVLGAWRAGDVQLDDYAAGSEGPASWPAIP
ncbi:glucose-6-phosphate dehydrogenase [Planctomonas sp. JC2975]|uniref:glucose-6-phosphate dehydrogenase n=1 Tax=Planctomonas sp. JC2975 TaxID=2729626 RepID=UPI00147314B3|nr:glucose-6-phosphate dehydrogenase [Planctomonas sp. JC2975]NNC11073.1 glucose-6-phosphate dehydrogenase [Planctomonas sp. JC2975]